MKRSNRQWRSCLALIGAIALSILGARAENAVVVAAAKPLADGVPQVAIVRLRALLGKNLPPEEWRTAAEKLAEALLAADQPAEALTLLQDTRWKDLAAAKFWRAQALAALRRWGEALPLYEVVAADTQSPHRAEAMFGAAEMLRALGRLDDALTRLNALGQEKDWQQRAQLRLAEVYLDKSDAANARRILSAYQPRSTTERKTRRFLQGRLEMVEHHPDRALAIFEPLLKRLEGASHPLAVATLFQVADAHLQTATAEAGDDFIEDFIEHHPVDVDLAAIFAKLDELYRSERRPARSELERWTREPEQPRRALAQWYLARIELRAGHREKALRLLGDLRASHPKTPAIAPALLEFAQLELEEGQVDAALSILDEARAAGPNQDLLDRIDLAAAQAEYRAKRLDAATAAYQRIAYSSSPFAKASAFNAALGWLELGDRARFAANYQHLQEQGADAESRAQLRLQEGLSQAAKGDEGAAQSLQNFVRDFPDDPRTSEAWVALAELAFHRTPPALDDARKYLARALGSKPTPAAQERAEYLSIWIEDAAGANDAKVIELANRFLDQHTTSPFVAEVRMKLAETYYRLQDFANAQTHFEILAQQDPNGALTEKALFFAAESAMSSMGQNAFERAVVLFDQVVQRKGELRWAARNEQALIERKLGKAQDALLLYDEVLKNDAKPSEKREALCGKGDIYFDLGAQDPKNYDRAIEAYDALMADARETGHWRNQALFKKGMCLEKKADRSAALAAFYDLIETQARPAKAPEFFWFYKAGFNAARLLEENSDWKAAAVVYEKLVGAGGPRSDEAKARLNRLRLEHFLWPE
jgi:TolA-binding protein